MNTVEETRLLRLKMLVERHKEAARLAEVLGKAPAQISQYITKNRSIGSTFARETEECLGLPRGWMDTPPTYAELQDKPDPMTMALAVMEQMPEDLQRQALRLLDALAQPPIKTGTDRP